MTPAYSIHDALGSNFRIGAFVVDCGPVKGFADVVRIQSTNNRTVQRSIWSTRIDLRPDNRCLTAVNDHDLFRFA